jgi:hypothetical protein
MSVKSRTIDDLGIDASNQYAKNKELELGWIKEIRDLPVPVQIGITPYISEAQGTFSLFNIGQPITWATFVPPPGYFTAISRLYGYQLIPSLGGTERLQIISDKLELLEEKMKPSSKAALRKRSAKNSKESDVEKREYQKVCVFLKILIESSRTFDLIKSRCNQYKQG